MKRALAIACLALLAAVPQAGAAGHPDARAHRTVVGGAPVGAEWGFTVAVLGDHTLCSGVVIAPTRVLTAAHCALALPITVIASRPSLRNPQLGEVIGVTDARVHPEFLATRRHDLAVLSLGQPTSAAVIQIASAEEDAAATVPGAQLGFAGFGEQNPLHSDRERVGTLATIEVRVRTSCQQLYRQLFSPQLDICALGPRLPRRPLSRSVCFGDSGGPLVADTPAGRRLVGVASSIATGRRRSGSSTACGFGRLPNVYARVVADLPFIRAALPAG